MSPPHWLPPARAERHRMAARRVALTGAGIISPLGNTLEDFYRSLAEAKSGIARLPEAIALGSGVQVGAMVDWKPAALFTDAELANMDRVAQFAIGAATQALTSSG